MKLKRTSLLFENSFKDAIKKNPHFKNSQGIKTAMHFINNVMMVNFGFNENACFLVDRDQVDKFLHVGHAENGYLLNALGKSTRVSSAISVLLMKYVKVEMFFYEKNVCIFTINATFDLCYGKTCSSGFGINPR